MKRALSILILLVMVAFVSACSEKSEPLVLYSGKGLKYAVDEIIGDFEQLEGHQVSVVYAGSKTLLNAIHKTHQGDIFLPGSESYLDKAGDLVIRREYLARHVPVFVVSAEQAGKIRDFDDLLRPEVRVAVGNSRMAAIGRVVEAIIDKQKARGGAGFNIVVAASTVNELLDLVINNEVDAALVWKDMLRWKDASRLVEIAIPAEINEPRRISIGVLATSHQPKLAHRFVDFAASKGRQIFHDRGFPE